MPRRTRFRCSFPTVDMVPASPAVSRARGFTILELLTATAILAAVLVMVFSALNHSIGIWRQANARIDAFQNARAVFDIMTSRLSQATLNTYWDYYDESYQAFRLKTNTAAFEPKHYGRYSDLHFICGPASALIPVNPPGCSALATQAVFFTVPTGLTTNTAYQSLPELLSACGFFVAFGGDDVTRPSIVPSSLPASYRWRLMELTAPSESLEVFASPNGTDWFTKPIGDRQARPLADNIIALVIWPRLAPLEDPAGTNIAPDYSYDSRTTAGWVDGRQPVQAHQLPPTLQVTMVAIDEVSAVRLQNGPTPPARITEALAGCFTGPVGSYADDLRNKLEPALVENHINYRIFTTSVPMRESRWSQ